MDNDKKLLAIMAHPDDAELRCFGTLMHYASQGYIVKVIVVCSGENGVSITDQMNTPENLIKLNRISETRKAFSKTSIIVEVLDFEDGNIHFNGALISEIEKEIKAFRPTVVITHFPESFGIDHQDHTNVGKSAINAASRQEFVKKILLCEPSLTIKSSFLPNYFVNIDNYFNMKMSSLKQHKSQQGRYYLTEKYHLNKAMYYGSNVSYNSGEKSEKFEAFQILFEVIS